MRQLLLYALCLIAPASAADQTACLGSHDTNGNGTVDIEDFLSILGVFGDVDTDGDGIWDSADLCTNAEACNFQLVPTLPCVFNDAVGICGGDCEADLDNDGICDWLCGDLVSHQGYDYATVLIGEQCWFAENLRSENYENGDAIPAGLRDSEWTSTTSGATAVYGEGSSLCNTYTPDGDACDETWSLNEYGRLYNWYAVDDSRGLCPSGWHVPTDGEWIVMTNFLGGESVAGGEMKTTYGWGDGGNGTNSSGFSGLPGGYRSADGYFSSAGYFGSWWSSSPNGSDAWNRYLYSSDEGVDRDNSNPQDGFSVRCVRDAE